MRCFFEPFPSSRPSCLSSAAARRLPESCRSFPRRFLPHSRGEAASLGPPERRREGAAPTEGEAGRREGRASHPSSLRQPAHGGRWAGACAVRARGGRGGGVCTARMRKRRRVSPPAPRACMCVCMCARERARVAALPAPRTVRPAGAERSARGFPALARPSPALAGELGCCGKEEDRGGRRAAGHPPSRGAAAGLIVRL